MLVGELKKPETERSHVFLFAGPTGSGKTTLARIMASKVGGQGFDLREMDFGAFRGIDQVRDLKEQSAYEPMSGSARVWIIDELQNANVVTQQALLKVLEDTPKSTYFFICTTDPDKLIVALRGRCKILVVKPLNEDEMSSLLTSIVSAEGDELTEEQYEAVYTASGGLPRNAIQLTEQLLSVDKDARDDVLKGISVVTSEAENLAGLLYNDAPWKKIAGCLTELKNNRVDSEGVRRQVLGYMASILLREANPGKRGRAAAIAECFEENTYSTGINGVILNCYRVVSM
jgi:DNA polymerase-3 subunit gamma/tau